MPSSEHTHTVIIGAGAAGLAVGACLKRAGVPFVLLEQAEAVGSAWRGHYDRLHLHTAKRHSALPHLGFPDDAPKYPSRQQVVDYLDAYARHFDLAPRFGQRVVSARRRDDRWETRTEDHTYDSETLVVATGYTRVPHRPTWPGEDDFTGPVLHSSAYRNGAPFAGKRVLVVGFGNSAGEIAIDLHEHGARPVMSVRGPVNAVPRDLLGLPILSWSLLLGRLPHRLADRLSAPVRRLRIGDLSRYGLRRPSYGPLTQIREKGRIPLLDVGTLRLIREGHILVRPGIARFTPDGVVFDDGTEERFDAVVLGTGYRPRVADFLHLDEGSTVVDADGTPHRSGCPPSAPGLYFCGFHVAPTGMLRAISAEAPAIAADIAADIG